MPNLSRLQEIHNTDPDRNPNLAHGDTGGGSRDALWQRPANDGILDHLETPCHCPS